MRALLALLGCAVALSGCGFAVKEPDLFVVTRTGPGGRLTELVNSDGTVRCNGRPGSALSSSLLITARDLQAGLHNDSVHHLRIARTPNAVYMYSVRTDAGTITFPDTAAARHPTLAQLELFAARAAHSSCGMS